MSPRARRVDEATTEPFERRSDYRVHLCFGPNCTPRGSRALLPVLEAAAAQGYVPDHVVGSGETPQGRPTPLMIYKACAELGVWPLARVVNTWLALKRKDGTLDAAYRHWILGHDAVPDRPGDVASDSMADSYFQEFGT